MDGWSDTDAGTTCTASYGIGYKQPTWTKCALQGDSWSNSIVEWISSLTILRRNKGPMTSERLWFIECLVARFYVLMNLVASIFVPLVIFKYGAWYIISPFLWEIWTHESKAGHTVFNLTGHWFSCCFFQDIHHWFIDMENSNHFCYELAKC